MKRKLAFTVGENIIYFLNESYSGSVELIYVDYIRNNLYFVAFALNNVIRVVCHFAKVMTLNWV